MDFKRTLLLTHFLALLIISTNALQASQYMNLSNTTEALELKGPIKTLNHNSNIYGKQTFEFDDSGYLTKAIFLYSNIDEETNQADGANSSGHQRIYIYHKDKTLLEIKKEPLNTTEAMSEGIKYYYNKNRTPHSSLEEGPLTREVTKFIFDNGKLSKEVVALITKDKLLPEVTNYTYQYDQNGLLELTTKQTQDSKTKQKIFRNDKGFIREVRFSWSDLHGDHEVKFSYKYLSFDEHGNWTKRTVTISGNDNKEVQTQEITYYK